MVKNERFPDIEIYIHQTTADDVQAWLESALGVQIFRKTAEYWIATYNNARLDIVFNPEVKKDFASLWFKQNATPWPTDLDCAKAANQALNSEVRCSTNGWIDETDDDAFDDIWFKVYKGQIKKVIWR